MRTLGGGDDASIETSAAPMGLAGGVGDNRTGLIENGAQPVPAIRIEQILEAHAQCIGVLHIKAALAYYAQRFRRGGESCAMRSAQRVDVRDDLFFAFCVHRSNGLEADAPHLFFWWRRGALLTRRKIAQPLPRGDERELAGQHTPRRLRAAAHCGAAARFHSFEAESERLRGFVVNKTN